MSIWCCSLHSRLFSSFLVGFISFSCFPGLIMSAVVTLDSIKIYNTREFLVSPTVYFKCKNENKTELKDVMKAEALYTFKGNESWQPLTELSSQKCKQCGLYELDSNREEDPFDEWMFCPSNFTPPDGKSTYGKQNQFVATFLCPECSSLGSSEEAGEEAASKPDTTEDDDNNNGEEEHRKKIHTAILVVVVVICVLAITSVIVAVVKSIQDWQKKKRQQEQARFLKLFEDGDEIEDELGLGIIV